MPREKTKAKERLKNSSSYWAMQRIATWMDRFYVDAILGLTLPMGIGDVITALFSLLFVWFALVHVRSIPLALAIVNNTLRDIAIGLIPCFIGDVLDFLHKSNRQNLLLINGFVDGDKKIIHEVNRKAVQSVVMIIVLIIIIVLLFRLVWLTAQALAWFISLFSAEAAKLVVPYHYYY
ncbi:MAG: DUF4112 domain-containing protein [Prevotella sp.]|nr:DUF4112 domain-containing protein [Prevotella sp.]